MSERIGLKRYEEAVTRLEYRAYDPPSREYVDDYVRGLVESGIEACWHSALNPDARPLFPSRVYPNPHPDASFEAFRYLIDRMHEAGRPVISWVPMAHSRAVAEVHPDWRRQPIAGLPGPGELPEDHPFLCYNSPFGDLLAKLAVEIVRDVGFDGIFFDGAYAAPCRCEHCAKKYREDTGRSLPVRWTWDDAGFRLWVNWRYEYFMRLWKRIVEDVGRAKPEATIVFNRKRRAMAWAWSSGVPFRTLGLDCVMGSERASCTSGDLKIKINTAYRCKRGTENWEPLYSNPFWVPDMEVSVPIHGALGCIAAGGGASCAMGSNVRLDEIQYALKALQTTLKPRWQYVGGETIEYAAILASQKTQDFWGKEDSSATWKAISGSNEVLTHAHFQTSVVFDDQLAAEELRKYPVVSLGNAACLNPKDADELAEYVEGGGVLFACGQVGTLDDLGYPHNRPVLDGLLGIRERAPVPERCRKNRVTLALLREELKDAECPYVTTHMMEEFAFPDQEVELLAGIREYPCAETGARPGRGLWPAEAEKAAGGLWRRRVGKGWVAYCAADLFAAYMRHPSLQVIRLVRRLLSGMVVPRVTIEAPSIVRMNARALPDGRWMVHLHNNPAFQFQSYMQGRGLADNLVTGELIPVHNVKILVNAGTVRSASSGVSGEKFAVRENVVTIARLDQHDVALLEVTAS